MLHALCFLFAAELAHGCSLELRRACFCKIVDRSLALVVAHDNLPVCSSNFPVAAPSTLHDIFSLISHVFPPSLLLFVRSSSCLDAATSELSPVLYTSTLLLSLLLSHPVSAAISRHSLRLSASIPLYFSLFRHLFTIAFSVTPFVTPATFPIHSLSCCLFCAVDVMSISHSLHSLCGTFPSLFPSLSLSIPTLQLVFPVSESPLLVQLTISFLLVSCCFLSFLSFP